MLIVFILSLINYAPIQGVHSSNLPSTELRIKYGVYSLNALQRLLDFFESDANNLNLDGLYGTRIAQGQLNALHQQFLASVHEKVHVTDRSNIIHSLSTQIERIANISLTQIARESTPYLRRFSLVIYGPFSIDYQPRNINEKLIESGVRNSDFDEDESDKCFAELLGKSTRKREVL